MTTFIYAGTTFETDQGLGADDFTSVGHVRVQTTNGGRYVLATGPGIPVIFVEVKPPGGKLF
ncbi:hypothetical protein [Curtobacterium flaccumfaciens]|uniref:hypothetical protein n=1 Tax=Curtobacterium flaccumfaciens TaxID=2035 RepID=UPI00188A6D1A|nr:hypothetical protein [Curtobacterium flaccumfaciens]MBF4628921.1 hypothetical protein [Curtobacterium flaccumfaciens]